MSTTGPGSSTNFFLELIDTGKIRTKEELRSLYHKVIKTYHPDMRPVRDRGVDFDALKRDYLAAAERLAELASAAHELSVFRYDAETFMGELRDLVARGLPVSERAVKKNKAYAASIDYVSKGIQHLYGKNYGFAELDGQLKFLRRRLPRVYYYALQVLWSCFDCAYGYSYAKTIAVRHLGCISLTLVEMGFGPLDAFLRDLIESAGKLSIKARLARRG